MRKKDSCKGDWIQILYLTFRGEYSEKFEKRCLCNDVIPVN